MHRALDHTAHQTDSMKMFLMGVEGGKTADGAQGAQPEWFYKDDGSSLVAPGAPLLSPDFALDAGEEPEIAGIYLIADDGIPIRLGYALANEFRSEEHKSELQSLMRISYAVFCLKKKKK